MPPPCFSLYEPVRQPSRYCPQVYRWGRGAPVLNPGGSQTPQSTLPAACAQRLPHTLPGGLSTPGPVGVFQGRESEVEEVPTNGFYRELSPHMCRHACIHVHARLHTCAHGTPHSTQSSPDPHTASTPGHPCEMLPSIWPQYPGWESIKLMSVMGRHASLQRC